MHTQYAYNYIHKDVLGLVVELDSSGTCQEFDFYELSDVGKAQVEYCSRNQNISSLQHEECSDRGFFISAKSKISLIQDLPLEIMNFMTHNRNPDQTECKICRKKMKRKSLLLHIAKSLNCKKSYGEEFDQLKVQKSLEKKAYIKRYKTENSQTIKEKQKDYNLRNRKRRAEDQFEKRDEIKKKKKEYYTANVSKIASRQRAYNKSHKDEIV